MAEPSGPLAGMRVVELTRNDPVSFCTMILGDLGAEVVRVQEVGGVRTARGQQEPEQRRMARPAHLDAFSRNKESIGLNLKHEEAQAILHQLCRESDVFIEGLRPGVTSRLGCDYETLKAINPRLVYCSLSGYGQDGPYHNLPGHDLNIAALSGALSTLLPPAGPAPALPMTNLVGDYGGGGMLAVIGILAAIQARDRVGGQFVDVSLFDGALYLMAFASGSMSRREQWPGLRGLAYYNLYQCRDGKYLSLCCLEPWLWENLCRAFDRPDLIPLQFVPKQQEPLTAILRERFLARSRDDWFDYFRVNGIDVPVAKVLGTDELFDDPQVQHRGMRALAGEVNGEPVYQLGIGPKFSATPGSIRRLGPTAGEDTDAILERLGYDPDRIAVLRTAGAVG